MPSSDGAKATLNGHGGRPVPVNLYTSFLMSLVGFFIIGVVPGERGPNMYGPGPNQRAR